MSKRKHPDRKLTLRECYDKYKRKHKVGPKTAVTYEAQLKLWERFSGNPPVGKITIDLLEDFRLAVLESGKTGNTVNSAKTCIKAILRRIGPPVTGNPWGLGIIDSVPPMEHTPVYRKPPYLIPEDDLNRVYVACNHAVRPSQGFPAAWWWQCLIVCAYTLGLRKSDLANIEMSNIDLENATLHCQALKTGKADVFPLHPVAVAHIHRLVYPRRYLFNGIGSWNIGRHFYNNWNRIIDASKIERRFTLKDLRSTAASKAERVRSGAGGILLQHVKQDVTSQHYLNMSEILRDVIEELDIPLAFRHGVGMAERAEKKKRKQNFEMHVSKFAPPSKPDPAEFRFEPDSFYLRGKWHSLTGAPWRALQRLAMSDQPVDVFDLATAIFGNRHWPREFYRMTGRVNGVISVIRKKLRQVLYLDDTWNPVPCTEKGSGGSWTLFFPAAIREGRSA